MQLVDPRGVVGDPVLLGDPRRWHPVAGFGSAADWQPWWGYGLLTPAELAARVEEGDAYFCGEWRAQTRHTLEEALGTRACFASSLGIRRGLWLAELALVNANQLMPKPRHLSWEEAACPGLGNSTAYR